MMNMLKKNLPVVLALLMTACAVASCGETTNPKETEAPTDTKAESMTETESVSLREPHKVPIEELNFNGAEYRSDYPDWQGYCFYFFADAETGDKMNDAIWHRQRKIEEELNVTFVNRKHDTIYTVVDDLRPAIQSGDDCTDAILLHCINGVSTLPAGGSLYNIDTLPYIDTSAEWWNRKQMDTLRLGENTYFAVSDFMIPCPYTIFFNKQLVSELDMDDPYELVFSGKWTLDVYEKMAIDAVYDLNGDGVMDTNDRYGTAGQDISLYSSFMTGAGQYMAEKNSEGILALTMNTPKTQSLLERFVRMSDKGAFYMTDTHDYQIDGVNIDTGKLMFQLFSVADAERFRNYTTDFGFLPYPKFDEDQENYISLDWGGLMAVPSTIGDADKVGAVMELLAYESANEVIPAYYDTVLVGKLARDPNAGKVLDIIFDTVAYDAGMNYLGSALSDFLYLLPRRGIEQKNAEFASFYESGHATAEKLIAKIQDNIAKAENADA